MFHASGWTFPWAITFAAAAQVCARIHSTLFHILKHLHIDRFAYDPSHTHTSGITSSTLASHTTAAPRPCRYVRDRPLQ